MINLRQVRLPWNSRLSDRPEREDLAWRPDWPKRRRVHSSGYLLLEVLLALAVLSISVVMIFKIIQTTLKVTSDINFLQTQQRKVDGISELLRRNFESLPPTCMFQTRKINGSLELIFRYAPFNFSWATAGASSERSFLPAGHNRTAD